MVVVRSVRMVTSMEAGRFALSWGRSFLTLSTTWMMFAPGWRWIFTMTAGTSFIQAASFEFSTASTIVATSDSITGAPFR